MLILPETVAGRMIGLQLSRIQAWQARSSVHLGLRYSTENLELLMTVSRVRFESRHCSSVLSRNSAVLLLLCRRHRLSPSCQNEAPTRGFGDPSTVTGTELACSPWAAIPPQDSASAVCPCV